MDHEYDTSYFYSNYQYVPQYIPSGETPYYPQRVHTYSSIYLDGTLLQPNVFINSFDKKDFSPRKIVQNQYTGLWLVKERDGGREIEIGIFELKDALIVNPISSTDYAAVKVGMKYEDKEYCVVIPGKDYKKRNILQYFPFFKRNPDCPDKYIVDAIYMAFQKYEQWEILVTPERSGWAETENGKLFFNSRQFVYPGLEVYYPHDICERQLVNTTRSLTEIAKEYAKTLPNIWQYKLLVAIRLASLLLYFAAKEGIVPDQLIVVEPASRSAAKTSIALLKTQNYQSQDVLSLMATNTELKAYLNKSNDGMVLFYDDAYVEEWKKHNNRVHTVLNDLQRLNGKENNPRHLITIISENPANLPPEIPAMYLNIADKVLSCDSDKLQTLTGEFDSALINAFENDPTNNTASVDEAIHASDNITRTIANSENINSKRLIIGGLHIMKKYNLISNDEEREIDNWLKRGTESSRDSALAITNDFRNVINKNIFSTIKVEPQSSAYNYHSNKLTMIADKDYINFEAGYVDKILLQQMKTTHKRKKLLTALNQTGVLHKNNGYKRNIEIETAPGIKETICCYSISKKILTAENAEKVNELVNKGFILDIHRRGSILAHPIATNKQKSIMYGQVVKGDENYHQYITGISRSGKTVYESEQAVAATFDGDQVVIFDNSGAWSEHEVRKRLSALTVDRLFSFWNIPKQGMPINLANLDNCDTLPEKKQRIFGILASAARVLGNVQEKVLYKRIGAMLKDKNAEVEISDILNYLDEEDETQSALLDKLEDVFEDYEDLPKKYDSWKEFFSAQKKIVIISTGLDDVAKWSHVIDMLLASLYTYKQHKPNERITVILDECEDLYLDTDGPVDIMLRKGAKHGIRMLLASQEFSAVKDNLGRIIGNCGTLVFFKPKDNNLAEISKLTGIDKSVLAKLEQGQCVVYGLLYNIIDGKNIQATIIGWTYRFDN